MFCAGGSPWVDGLGPAGWGNLGSTQCLRLLQVLERWCSSPRTIEVLMNTYSAMKLPAEAAGLVPPEILQVRLRDPDHTTAQPVQETPTSYPMGPPPQKFSGDPLMSQKRKT